MSRRPSIRRVWLALAALSTTIALASPPGESADEGVVVLRNGNVLTGAVRRTGRYYRIEADGSTLQVPAGQVEMACHSMEEAYEMRRRNRVGSSVDSHLELARWCLRHDLLGQAARELLDARSRDPGHPALGALELQLRQGLEIAAGRRQRVADSEASAKENQPEINEPALGAVLLNPSTEAQSQFVRSIQPMLIHSCTTSGCHASDAKHELELDRWALEGNGNPTLIRRNLEEVLRQIDKDDPASSPLMRRARQAHGYRTEPTSTPLAPYQAALLLEWINEVAGKTPPAPAERSPASLPRAAETEGVDAARSIDPSERPPASRRPDSPFSPRDRFDPEIFNRRNASSRQSEAEEVPDTIEMEDPSGIGIDDVTGSTAADSIAG